MKEQLLKRLMYGAAFVSMCLLAVGYSPFLLDLLTVSDQEGGEFYRLTKVSYFREAIPPIDETGREASSDGHRPEVPEVSTRVLTMGDSFFWLEMGYRDFSTELEEQIGEPVRYAGHWRYHNPFEYISKYDAQLQPRRTLVVGVVERHIHRAFGAPWAVQLYQKPSPLRAVKNAIDPYTAYVFDGLEDRLRYFMEYNRLSFFVASLYRGYRFEKYGEIRGYTPFYLRSPRQQFHYETVEVDDKTPSSYYYDHSDSLIAAIAQNLQQFQEDLREHANTDLVFVPIPNKITIYQEYLDTPYDRYLPRLHAELERRGVPNVNLYDPFRAAEERLYYISDPHWNAKGRAIAFEEVERVLQEVWAAHPEAIVAGEARGSRSASQ